MKRVFLIRHGLPDFPDGKRMCLGRTDLPLCQEGYAQAKEMAAKLPPVTDVFSSPLSRAVQTAQAIGLPVTVLEDLQELSAGDWDGLTFGEIRLRYPELYTARATDRTLPLPGAEDNAAGLSRFQKALSRAAFTAAGDLAVVAHGGVIALFLQSLSGCWYKPGYARIIPLIWNNGTFITEEEFDHA